MKNNYEYDCFEMKQPIGDLFCALIPSEVIIEVSSSKTRTAYNDKGIQRKLDRKRVEDISMFCQHSDAMFPTPIVLSASSDYVKMEDNKIKIDYESIKEKNKYCGIIDGQHRLEGISESKLEKKFELLVLFVFDVDVSTEAKLFSIINGKQKPIAKSLIYDLARLSDIRTVEKVCSETVNYLNNNEDSELYHQIKILGYKEYGFSLISQSALVASLMKLISRDVASDNLKLDKNESLEIYHGTNEYILRPYFINKEDEKIKKIVFNYLNAWIENLRNFDLLNTLIGKTIGFNATFKLFPKIFLNFREKEISMSKNEFYEEIKLVLEKYINEIVEKEIDEKKVDKKEVSEIEMKKAIENHINSYGSSQGGSNRLAKDLIEKYNED